MAYVESSRRGRDSLPEKCERGFSDYAANSDHGALPISVQVRSEDYDIRGGSTPSS